jgi:hypothetical protein
MYDSGFIQLVDFFGTGADAGGPGAPAGGGATPRPETVKALAEVVSLRNLRREAFPTGTVLFSDLTPNLPALVLFGVDVEIKFSGH